MVLVGGLVSIVVLVLMVIRDFFRELDKSISKFDVRSYGYKVNRWLTNGSFLILILLLGYVASVDGVASLRGSLYMECPLDADGGSCANPFYDEMCGVIGLVGFTSSEAAPVVVCEPESVPAGWTYGEKPSWVARNFGWLALFIVLSGLVLNHLLYNRGWRFNENVKK